MLNTKRLKSLRKKLGYTQKDVALKLRVTLNKIIKSGKVVSPSLLPLKLLLN